MLGGMGGRAQASIVWVLVALGSCTADSEPPTAPAESAPAVDAAADRGCVPAVSLTPDRGPVGTRIAIQGRCFSRQLTGGYGIHLLRQFFRPRECELIAGGRQRLRVHEDGTAEGFVVVSETGSCFQHRYRRRVTPGAYGVFFGCHACGVRGGRFRVTPR